MRIRNRRDLALRYDTVQCGAVQGTDRLDERWSRGRKGRRPRETINHLESILLFLLLLHTSRSVEIARQPQDYWLNERESTRQPHAGSIATVIRY